MSTMNAYQKVTILIGGALLPLLLLFMRAMGYAGVWIATSVGIAILTLLVYALRNAQTAEEGG
jgi:hypothetical protein